MAAASLNPVVATQKSRAGRNLPLAIAVGLVFFGIVVFSIFWRPEPFVVLLTVLACLAIWEMSRVLVYQQIHLPLPPLLVGAAGIMFSTYIVKANGQIVALIVSIGAVVLWRALDGGGRGALRDIAGSIFTLIYIPFLLSFAILVILQTYGPWRVLTILLLVIANDLGGYIAGVLFGKHPMAPTLSPKKSWEGFAGSIILSFAIGALLVPLKLPITWWAGAGLALMMVITATLGDLSASLLKRDLKVKDMGFLVPGHGGIMDRLDSVLLSAPIAYVALLFLLSAH